VPAPVTLTLTRKDGSSSSFVVRHKPPRYIDRAELKNGFATWAIKYAAKHPQGACVKRRYVRVGETLEYREE